jgi:hypothetical protein
VLISSWSRGAHGGGLLCVQITAQQLMMIDLETINGHLNFEFCCYPCAGEYQRREAVEPLSREKRWSPYLERSGGALISREAVEPLSREERWSPYLERSGGALISRGAVEPLSREERWSPYLERSGGALISKSNPIVCGDSAISCVRVISSKPTTDTAGALQAFSQDTAAKAHD